MSVPTASPTKYVVPVYTPDPSLVSLHSLPRVVGSSQFPVFTSDSLADITARTGPVYDYLQGCAVPAVVLIIVFIIWACLVCCLKCCCFPPRPPGQPSNVNKPLGLFVFTISGVGSCVAWFISMGANAKIAAGVAALIKAGDDVFDLGDKAEDIADGVVNMTNTLLDIANHANTTCQVQNVSFPLGSVIAGIQGVQNEFSSISNELSSTINGFNSEFTKGTKLIDKYVSDQQTATWTLIVVTLVFTAIFTFTTIVRVLDKVPERFLKVFKVLNQITSWTLFILGPLLILVIVIIFAIIDTLSIVGADLCVPSPSANINAIIAGSTGLSDSSCVEGSAYQSSSTGALLCYYETCNGTSFFTTLLANVSSQSLTALNAFPTYNAQVSQLPPPYNHVAADCENDINEIQGNLTSGLETVITNVTALVECPSINPIYNQLLNLGICNGLIAGLAETTQSIITATILLMIALLVYRVLDMATMERNALVYNSSSSMMYGGATAAYTSSQPTSYAHAAPIVVGAGQSMKLDPDDSSIPTASAVKE